MAYKRNYRKKQVKKRYGAKSWLPKVRLELGKNVPFVGGSKLQINKVRRLIKSEMNRQEETKQLSFSFGRSTLEHNSVFSYIPYIGMPHRQEIKGSQCYFKSFIMRFAPQTARTEVVYRVLGVWTPKDIHATGVITTTSTNTLQTAITPEMLFIPSNGYIANSFLNNKLPSKVVFDRTYKFGRDSGTDTRVITCTHHVNRKVTWHPSLLLLNDMNFSWVIVGYAPDLGTTATTSNLGSINIDSLVTYKDD